MSAAADLDLLLDGRRSDPSVVRRMVEEHCQRLLTDEDAVDRLAMAAHELLENAFRHSADHRARLRIQVSRGDLADRVALTVHNAADEAHAGRLQAVVREMAAFGNPAVYLRIVMGRLAGRRGSGLGLARISAEGGMTLSVVREGGQVTLRAEAEIERAPS